MALITKDNIKSLIKKNSVHSKVRATYTTFTSEEKNTFKLIPTEVPQEK